MDPLIQYDHFYTNAEIDAFANELAERYPDLCRFGSLGTSREGQAIPLLTLTDFATGVPEDRPGFVIHAGIHAHEPASAHGALYTALQLAENHPKNDLLARVAFYITPRLCPDASEFCIKTSTRVRSRTDFENRESNVVYPEDIDGNGLILTIRQEHPDGNLVLDEEEPRLLVQRRADSSGPFYRTFPEGLIFDWDGGDRILQGGLQSFIPDPTLAGGGNYDWNRNWSYNWKPEQTGAGDYPFSEPELKQFADFLFGHSRIFAVLGYHCGHESVIRPPASGSRSDLHPEDDRLIEELAQIGVACTHTPILPLVTDDSPGKGGHSLDTIYHHLGVLGLELELGTVTNDAGLTTEEFLEWKDGDADRWNRRLLAWWDERRRPEPLFEPWQPFDHPQLGRVEIGGWHYTAWDNPLVSALEPTLEGCHRFTLELAERHPHVRVDRIERTDTGLSVSVANRGQLPTNVTRRGRDLHRMRPVEVRLSVEGESLPGQRIDHLTSGSEAVVDFSCGGGPAELIVDGGSGGRVRQQVDPLDKAG